MAHRALALKYRPQTFSDVIGQEHVTAVLTRALEGDRVAHAYLFTGARGVGKTTCARLMAKALDCERRGTGSHSPAEPCGQCTSCVEITAGTSLDVAEIDGASNRGIADVQALREKVRFTPTGGRYRVMIIDEVHQLSNDAFAALLKTLEEPPPHLVFVFATTDPQKLPETIRSRTQRFDFARVPLRKVADRLIELQRREAADPEGVPFTLTEGAALLIAHKSEGSMRDAVSGLDQVVSAGEPVVDEALVRRVLGIADREAFFTIAGAILARDPKMALRALHAAFEKGLDARDLAEGLSEHVRHLLVLKVDPEAGDLVALAREDLDRLRQQGAEWSENDLLRLLRLASEASGPMRDSPQPLVHLEVAVLQMATLEPGETLAELLSRLEDLERRLSGGAPSAAPGGGAGGPARPQAPAPPRPAAPAPAPGPRAQSAAPAAPPLASPPRASAPAAPPPPAAPAPGPRASSAAPAAAPPAPAPAPSPRAAAPASPSAPRAAAPPAAVAMAPPPPEDRGAVWPSVTGPVRPAGAPDPSIPVECDERLSGCWRATLEGINGRKRMLGAFLEASRFVGLAGDVMVVAMDQVHSLVALEKDNLTIIQAEAQRAFGRAVRLYCAPLDAGDQPKRPALRDVEPMVERAIEFFQGEVVEPKPKPKPARREWERKDNG
jgi:DNA polymerase III subunit gamma/tau